MRKKCIASAKRIVVKVGSAILTDEKGKLDRGKLTSIVDQVVELKKAGNQMILVTSGAIAAGLERLGMEERPSAIPELQAAASVGQGLLLQLYTNLFDAHSIHVGQVLLTQYDITHREHYVNAANTFDKLMEFGVVPVINENDTTVVEEIKFGDNDTLAALVANLVKADALVILSDVDGLHTADPRRDAKAPIIHEVAEVTKEIEDMAGGAGTMFGSGGMVTKLNAAKIVTMAGAGMFLLDGRESGILSEVFLDCAQDGTFFAPRANKMTSRKAWLAFATQAAGSITIDEGAKNALVHKGRSLLPAGVLDVTGDFGDGDTVEVIDEEGDVLAKGLVNFQSGDLRKIKGLKTEDIKKRHKELLGREVIHRDCLVVLK
jgi:glutamate 5-kinase